MWSMSRSVRKKRIIYYKTMINSSKLPCHSLVNSALIYPGCQGQVIDKQNRCALIWQNWHQTEHICDVLVLSLFSTFWAGQSQNVWKNYLKK